MQQAADLFKRWLSNKPKPPGCRGSDFIKKCFHWNIAGILSEKLKNDMQISHFGTGFDIYINRIYY